MTRLPCPGCGVDSWSEVELNQHKEQGHFALADRRQRALEALYDARSSIRELPAEVDPVMAAVETATRIRLDGIATRAAMTAYANATGYDMPSARGMDAALTAAFRAAGFEVEE